MNLNPHSYENFHERMQRLTDEAGLTAKELSAKIGVSQSTVSRYMSGAIKPPIETLVAIADTLDVQTDYLLCRKSSILSMNSPKDNIHIYEKREFDFKQLADEFDQFLAATLENSLLEKNASDTVSLITILLTIYLRDTTSLLKHKYDVPANEFSAFYIRSLEIQKLVNHLFAQLTQDTISRCSEDAQYSVTKLNMNASISLLIHLFSNSSDILKSTLLDNLLLTLADSVKS